MPRLPAKIVPKTKKKPPRDEDDFAAGFGEVRQHFGRGTDERLFVQLG